MLLGIHDDSVLAKFEQFEKENPCPRKELDGYTIYLSRPMLLTKGEPAITDLSEARYGDSKHTDWIMPNVYRAPEVILGLPWSYPVDIWGFAMVVSLDWRQNHDQSDQYHVCEQLWDLFQPDRLFSAQDSRGRYSEAHHLAAMISIMGPPSVEFLRKCGEKTDQYWDNNGELDEMSVLPSDNYAL